MVDFLTLFKMLMDFFRFCVLLMRQASQSDVPIFFLGMVISICLCLVNTCIFSMGLNEVSAPLFSLLLSVSLWKRIVFRFELLNEHSFCLRYNIYWLADMVSCFVSVVVSCSSVNSCSIGSNPVSSNIDFVWPSSFSFFFLSAQIPLMLGAMKKILRIELEGWNFACRFPKP